MLFMKVEMLGTQKSAMPLSFSILFAASAFRKLSSIYVFSYFPFGFEGRIWDLIVSVPDHCLSFYFDFLLIYKTDSAGSRTYPLCYCFFS